ncbi:MAG: glycosyltransferase [Gammaproteobacteria bacterium]|nr:glycosyltransferase [Gammaproteobacteria bacterium]
MRVAIIAHALAVGGGVRVGQELIASLQRHAASDHYLITIPEGKEYERYITTGRNTNIYTCKSGLNKLRRWLFDEFILPDVINEFKPHVVFALGNRMVSRVKAPQAMLLQDAHFVYPSSHYGKESFLIRCMVELHRTRLKRNLKKARLTFCQTDVMASRLVKVYHGCSKIAICQNGTDNSVNIINNSIDYPSEYENFKNKIRLLLLTRYYPYKNIEILIELFRFHKNEMRDVVIFITIDSKQHKNVRNILHTIKRYQLENQLVNIGPLPRERLGSYYRNAHALIFPTLLESFSGTYIEAMQYDCPILTSDIDFARSICHDAALYFNPYNTESIKNTIQKFCTSPELQQELKLLGKARLTKYILDWDSIAAATYKELNSIALDVIG